MFVVVYSGGTKSFDDYGKAMAEVKWLRRKGDRKARIAK